MKARSGVVSFSGLFLLIAIPTFSQTKPALANQTEASCRLANRAVRGAPYSALQETTRTQTLGDGTHIERQGPSMQAYRDSEGRQREEFYQVLGPAGAEEKFLSNVIISNPVECVVYNLDVAHHVARRRTFSSDATDATGQSKVPAGLEHRALPEELRPKTSVEHLGADSIEGLAVEGLRTSTTFPVGSQGNDRPIVAIYEIWTSPQLKVPVLERTSDPRSGERTTRLRNIDLVEPSAELFRVPADYQIQDEHQ